jgi:cell division protein FtsQ
MAARSRGTVNDRLPKWRLYLRGKKWALPYAGWACFVGVVVAAGAVASHTGAPGSAIASVREKIGRVAANAGMRVVDIKIEGRANTPEPFLRAALGINKGDPIIGFSLEQARRNIEKLTWVAHAAVERRLPGTIVVALTEKRPFAVWQYQGKDTLIDRDGNLVTDEDLSKYRQLPLIVGAGAPEAARTLIDALIDRPTIFEHVVAAMRVGERRWNLRLKNHADVLLPEGHEIEALDRLVILQRDTALLDRPLAAIDMRLADKLVLRPLATQKGDPADAGKPAQTPQKKPA